MDILIREMNLTDGPFVFEEEQKIYGKTLTKQALYNDIVYNDQTRYFIAKVEDDRVGYVGIFLKESDAEIINIFVSEKYRAQGIGKKLMEKVIDICYKEKISKVNLEVRQDNKVALKMYEDLGFKLQGVLKNYYKNRDNAILLVLELGGI